MIHSRQARHESRELLSKRGKPISGGTRTATEPASTVSEPPLGGGRRVAFSCVLLALLATAAGSTARAPAAGDLEIAGRVLRPGAGASAGADLLLAGTPVPRNYPRGGDFVLLPGNGSTALPPRAASASCLCGPDLFADGFETGNTSAWSSSAP